MSEKSTFAERLRTTEWSAKWGWNMFTLCMGTGAVAVTVNSIPYKFNGQHALGSVFLIIDIILFIFNMAMFSLRAIRHPRIFIGSFYDETETIWFPTFNLACATILFGIISYGIPYCGDWLVVTVEVLIYVYMFLGAITGLILQNTFRRLPRPLEKTAPSEALEIFPLMLVGSLAGAFVSDLVKVDPGRALVMLLFGYVMQGLGFFMGLLKLAVWMVHHVTLGRAPSKTLPSYMIAAGPPGFTALALVNLGQASLTIFPANDFLSGLGGASALVNAQIFAAAGIWFALMLTGMFLWVTMIYIGWSLLSGWKLLKLGYRSKYELSWWCWTFPIAGQIVCFGRFAEFFPSRAFGVLNIMGTIFVFIMWCINITGTITLLFYGQPPGTAKPFSQAMLNGLEDEGFEEEHDKPAARDTDSQRTAAPAEDPVRRRIQHDAEKGHAGLAK